MNHQHLRLGTHRSNMQDMVRDGRSGKGERHGQAKLTEKGVRGIKRDLAQGDELNVVIAKRYGVTKQTISDIKHGRSWGHVVL